MKFGMLVVGVALVGAGMFLGNVVFSQEKGKPSGGMGGMEQPNMEEMMKKWQDSLTPGKQHAKMMESVGKWDTESKIWMQPGMPPMISKGRAEIKSAFGGRFTMMDSEGSMMGMPTKGTGYTGYDNFKKKYVMVWISDQSTGLYTAEGTEDESGKVVTFMGKMDEPMTGEKDKDVTYVARHIDKDKFVFEIHDPIFAKKGMETKVVEITYTRAK